MICDYCLKTIRFWQSYLYTDALTGSKTSKFKHVSDQIHGTCYDKLAREEAIK